MGGKTKRNIKIKKMKASFFGAIKERAKRYIKKTPDSIDTNKKLYEARISSREQGKIKLYNATAESLKNLSKEKPKRRIRLIYTPMGNKR